MSRSAPERRLQRLDWTIVRRLDGLLQGDYRTVFKGQGLDLADIREYAFGDDVRHIDWNVTARLDTPYVREYLEDREISAHFLLDLSPSVDFGTVDRRKRDLLLDLTAVLARLLTRHGNKVGARASCPTSARSSSPIARLASSSAWTRTTGGSVNGLPKRRDGARSGSREPSLARESTSSSSAQTRTWSALSFASRTHGSGVPHDARRWEGSHDVHLADGARAAHRGRRPRTAVRPRAAAPQPLRAPVRQPFARAGGHR